MTRRQATTADSTSTTAAQLLRRSSAIRSWWSSETSTTDQRGPLLQSGDIDVLIRNTTWTVSRDTSWGLFGPTTFYDGQAIMVNSTLTDATTVDELAGATVCVQSGTTTELNLTDRLGDSITPQVFPEIDPTYAAYEEGRCDAVTSDRSQLVARRTAFANPGDHLILDEIMSKEPLGPVAPLGDDQWFNVVKWTVYATIEAEEQGITQANVSEQLASTNPVVQRLLGVTPAGADPFDSGLGLDPDWVVNVISAVGNYSEIYDRNLGPGTPFDLDRGLQLAVDRRRPPLRTALPIVGTDDPGVGAIPPQGVFLGPA